MPIPMRLDACLAKFQTTAGTDPVPVVGTDGVRVAQRIWPLVGGDYAWENLREETATGTPFRPAPAAKRGRHVIFEVPWEIKGSGVAYSAGVYPEASPLLRACGWAQVGSFGGGAEKYTYTLVGQLHELCTIYLYAGGLLFKVLDCRGTLRWPLTAGETGVMRFQMQGLLPTDPTAAAVPAVSSYDTTDPVAGVSMSLTVGGSWTPDVLTAEYAQGADVQRLDSLNAADGIREFDWAELNPIVTLSAKAPRDGAGLFDLATYNPWADAAAKPPMGRTLAWTHGSAQYNRVKYATATAYVKMPKHAAQNTFAGIDLTYDVNDSAQSITFD
jgi:hypothetical protein